MGIGARPAAALKVEMPKTNSSQSKAKRKKPRGRDSNGRRRKRTPRKSPGPGDRRRDPVTIAGKAISREQANEILRPFEEVDFSQMFGELFAGPEIGLVPIHHLKSAPENESVYRPVTPDDPGVQALAECIKQKGVLEPIVSSNDHYILSGHRRRVAAELAGLKEVPVRRLPISRFGDPDEFMRLLVAFNRQRNKSLAEKLNEELVAASPEDAHEELLQYRFERAADTLRVKKMDIGEARRRPEITAAKFPMLKAAKKVISERDHPPSVRAIHYAFVSEFDPPPLRHASKPDSFYENTRKCYSDLSDLLTRARIEGLIPMDAIADETRPINSWRIYADPQDFLRAEREGLFKGYYRNLMLGQPAHIEMVCEKNTIAPIIRPVAASYCIPLTTGRGYCSLPPRYQMVQRFKRSGADRLVILFMSDFDPEGEDIAASFARSVESDFHVTGAYPVKVALNISQVKRYRVPAIMQAKKTSSRAKKFVEQHGKGVWELEALNGDRLREILRNTIESVIDREMFDAQVEQEKKDAAYLHGVRQTVHAAMLEMGIQSEPPKEGA